MSDAARKNEAAITLVTGNAALAARLRSLRIGIWSDSTAETTAGRLIAEALGDVLGRFWYQIDAAGPLSGAVVQAVQAAAASGGQPTESRVRWVPPYDYVIAIACDAPGDAGPMLRIGADGWIATAGPLALVSDDRNPVGPACIAALAAAEAFKTLFADDLRTLVRPLPASFTWSAWDYGAGGPAALIAPLHLDHVLVFGVGAVTHGLLWVLERWPAAVTGTMRLIDGDKYDVSNGQRYPGMRSEDVGALKAAQASRRLGTRHPGLDIRPYGKDMNRYFAEENPDCRADLAVAGLDSPEARRQLALKLPRRTVNMWTDEDHLGAARFGVGDGWPCLYCAYPEVQFSAFDEVGSVVQQTGLQPARVRVLLNTAAPLEPADVAVIAQRVNAGDVQAHLGRPLRSVLGALCATGRITLAGAETVVVPFGFSSFLAGIAGFVELAREVWAVDSAPGHWQLPVFAAPVAGNWLPRSARPDCYLCADTLASDIMRAKYA